MVFFMPILSHCFMFCLCCILFKKLIDYSARQTRSGANYNHCVHVLK